MVRVVATALLAVSLLLAPAAAASKPSEARRYALAIHAYEQAERDAVLAAAPAYHARRDAVAAGCLDVVADGAPHRLFELVALYGYWATRPLAEAAQPEADRLVRRFRQIPTRSRPLRRARRAHARRNREYRTIPALMPEDVCAVLREWQSTGWKRAAEPESSKRVFALIERVHERDDAAIARGARFLRRHGVSAHVADVFNRGNADGSDPLLADDPVFQAMEDAVNQP
jgi:cell division septum initiation protein DivIVA